MDMLASVYGCTRRTQADQRLVWCAVREAFITQQQQEHGGGEGEIELLAFRVKDAQVANLFKEKFQALQKGVPIAAGAAPKGVPVTADAAPKGVPVTADATASKKVTQGANAGAENGDGNGSGNGKDDDDASPLICRESFWRDEGVEGDCAPLMNRNAGFAKLGDEALLKRASRCLSPASDPSQSRPEISETALSSRTRN
jgi:hypothetical protein